MRLLLKKIKIKILPTPTFKRGVNMKEYFPDLKQFADQAKSWMAIPLPIKKCIG